jgi:hypothetical protein
MRTLFRAIALLLLVSLCVASPLQALSADPTAEQRAALEKDFADTLSGATFVGSFTLTGAAERGRGLAEERYTINKVAHLKDDVWLFTARIQYGEHDLTLPIPLEVHRADDTPVITLTDAKLPGLGTFTARVLIYRDHYAGFWNGGGDHGGHLFGRIERAKPPADDNPSQPEKLK